MSLKLSRVLRGFIFSRKCSLCCKETEDFEEYICRQCREKLFEKKKLHKRKNIYFLFNYTRDIRNLIIDYKFNDRKYIVFFLAKLIKDELAEVIREKEIDIVVPVPSDKKRLLSRGFNQVEIILDVLGIKYKSMERVKETMSMHILSDKNLRSINIKSAFKINFETKDKNILIFDDIITTGSTVSEIIKAVEMKGKPKNIYVFSISAASTFYKSFIKFSSL